MSRPAGVRQTHGVDRLQRPPVIFAAHWPCRRRWRQRFVRVVGALLDPLLENRDLILRQRFIRRHLPTLDIFVEEALIGLPGSDGRTALATLDRRRPRAEIEFTFVVRPVALETPLDKNRLDVLSKQRGPLVRGIVGHDTVSGQQYEP